MGLGFFQIMGSHFWRNMDCSTPWGDETIQIYERVTYETGESFFMSLFAQKYHKRCMDLYIEIGWHRHSASNIYMVKKIYRPQTLKKTGKTVLVDETLPEMLVFHHCLKFIPGMYEKSHRFWRLSYWFYNEYLERLEVIASPCPDGLPYEISIDAENYKEEPYETEPAPEDFF